MSNDKSLFKIFDRFLEVYDYMNRKYIELLEEAVLKEAEILSKQVISEVDIVKLWGYNAMKKIIAEELGLTYNVDYEEDLVSGEEEVVEITA
ncbi:MAG: hypothetical protein B6U89_05275 [Desulfurococcales archaeon ex4484_58]|nr:MAG: hypothetical protein B6U89_05275 [Desulfurococcales archaeon ex4484_58]